MSITKILSLSGVTGDITGVTVSPFYQLYDDANGYTWAVDVDLGDGSEVLRGVAVASNNRELFYADQGKPVALRKENNRYVVIGLSKTIKSYQHIMYVCFDDDIAQVVDDEMAGYKVRALTYGELGTLVPPGYGAIPYGAMGRFDFEGNLIEIIESRPI
jgi:hypothetical protein